MPVQNSKNVAFVALGCPKNAVEGESMVAMLVESGYVTTGDIGSADIVIIHTCSFIEDAKIESAQWITSVCKQKKQNQKIFVSGCLVQSEKEKLLSKFPKVDGFVGTGHLGKIAELVSNSKALKSKILVGAPGGLLETSLERPISWAFPSAYLRVSEGCNHKCLFCIIPKLRGKYKSRTIESLVAEAAGLAKKGVKEIILIGQDTTAYGKDIYGTFVISKLIREISKINDIRWIRVLYAFPNSVTQELLKEIASNKKVCKYIDIPLQHVSDKILKLMLRPKGALGVLKKIKSEVPGIFIRSTLIVGLPGETPEQFAELTKVVKDGWFDHLGVFEYSNVDGAKTQKIPGKISARTKKARKDKLMLLQKKVVSKKNAILLGKVFEAVAHEACEFINAVGKKVRGWKGRVAFQSIEIDGCVFFEGYASVGEFLKVKITGYKDYDLLGVVINE